MQVDDSETSSSQTADTGIPLTNIPLLDPSLDPAKLSVSPAFYPGAFDEISDTFFLSSDSVLFYFSSSTVTRTHPNAFRRVMGIPLTDAGCRDRLIRIDESSSIVAVMLHALYDTPCSPVPTLDDVVAAVDKMRSYEISPAVQLESGSQMYKLILSFAPLRPLEVYALAASHRLEGMAMEASSHLVSYPLFAITDEVATRIGSSYLLRLFQWRLHRTNEMKRILLKAPYPHPATEDCSLERQQILTKVWAEVSSNVVYGGDTDLTLSFLHSLLDPHLSQITCGLCKGILENQIRSVIVEWSGVPRTIPPAA